MHLSHYRRCFILSAALAVSALGCAVESARPDAGHGPVAEVTRALAGEAPTYVTARIDRRDCAAPACGGFWIHALNGADADRYASSFDFSATRFGDELEPAVAAAPLEDIVLRGAFGPPEKKFGTRQFAVQEVYRGLPHVAAAVGENFFQVREAACPPAPAACAPSAWLVNVDRASQFDSTSVERASLPMVDQSWLRARVAAGAIVAAKVSSDVDDPLASVLDASQVYVRLPERPPACPPAPAALCSEGLVPAFRRTEERCLVADGCAPDSFCSAVLPACEDGYIMSEWTAAPNACSAYACDPAFTVR